MRPLILLLILPLLAACATPRESCLKSAANDVFIVDRLIGETQANIQRGFAYRREAYTTTTVDLCLGSGRYGYRHGGVGWTYCTTPSTSYRKVPVAIDVSAERRKLNELQQTRARLMREVEPRLAYCNAKYPQ